jgi:hypothetical protein
MDAFKIKYGVFISVCDTKPVLSALAWRVYPSHTHTHTLSALLHWADREIVGCQLTYRVHCTGFQDRGRRR